MPQPPIAFCDFSGPDAVCPFCGFPGEPGAVKNCKGPRVDYRQCVHRGEAVRTVECESCGGNWSLKLFACALYGECSLSAKADVRFCGHCPDAEASE